jgi:copper(I)-binding protein
MPVGKEQDIEEGESVEVFLKRKKEEGTRFL